MASSEIVPSKGSRRRRGDGCLAAFGVAVFSTALFTTLLALGAGRILIPRPFDSGVWKRAADDDFTGGVRARQRMMGDLLRNRLKPGMGGAQVIDLLGPPRNDARPRAGTGCLLEYETGPDRGPGVGFDSEFLQLEFSGDAYVGFRTWES